MPLLTLGTGRALLGGGSWTPANPTGGGASPRFWLKADAGTWQDSAKTTIALADGDPIGAWGDQSDNADDVIQATAAKKPTLKLNIRAGQPVLRFDGGDYLSGTFTTGGAVSQPFTVFAVAQLDASAVNDNAYHWLVDGLEATNRMSLFQHASPSPDEWAITSDNVAALQGNAADNDWNIWTVLFNGASSQFWHNGVSEASGNAGAGQPAGAAVGVYYTGANYFWLGDIAEIIVYSGNLSTADKNQVGNYLATRYNITYAAI